MATRAELQERERARETRINDAVTAMTCNEKGGQDSAITTLHNLADAIDAEGAELAEHRNKGWQSALKAHVAAAEIVRAWRDRVTAYTSPAPPPVPTGPSPTADAEGIAIDHRAGDPNELDARLEAAFGIPPVTRHIRAVVEPPADHDCATHTGFQHWGAMCGSTEGSWTHPGGANCVDCHALYTEHNDGKPYDGPVAHGNERPDGPVTPEVARAIREEIEREKIPTLADLGITLNDPGSPPRLTLSEISAIGRARNRGADHRSFSQLSSFEECGARYALDTDDRPAWWNVGGTAFHNAAMLLNQAVTHPGVQDALVDRNDAALWSVELDKEIARVRDESGIDPDHWRAANKGTEHYDWWRVEGPVMVEKYRTWLAGMLDKGWRIATDATSKPMVEYETSFYVPQDNWTSSPNGSAGYVKVDNVIDLVLTRPNESRPADPEYLIVDLKSGAKAPTSNLQLAFYHWALASMRAGTRAKGCYYLARRGETTAPADLAAAYPWHDLAARIVAMDQQERAGLYIPRPNMFCRACPAARICPEGPR